MPTPLPTTEYQRVEMGSYHGSGAGGIDLSDFMNKLKSFYPGIEQDEIFPKAIMAGCEYLRDRIVANTPLRKEQYFYKYKGRTIRIIPWRPKYQAARNVIVYKRKIKGKQYYQEGVNVNLSYLVGYEKSQAYFMYWNEYGSKQQPARPVIRPVFDSSADNALQLAQNYISQAFEKRLNVMK